MWSISLWFLWKVIYEVNIAVSAIQNCLLKRPGLQCVRHWPGPTAVLLNVSDTDLPQPSQSISRCQELVFHSPTEAHSKVSGTGLNSTLQSTSKCPELISHRLTTVHFRVLGTGLPQSTSWCQELLFYKEPHHRPLQIVTYRPFKAPAQLTSRCQVLSFHSTPQSTVSCLVTGLP